MPLISTLGAASSRGFGQLAQSSTGAKYIEDYFSTWLYTGNGSSQTINNGIPLITTDAWSTYKVATTTENKFTAADSSGNMYIVGQAITKLSSTGAFQWSRRIQLGSYYMTMNGVVVGSTGDIYVAGTVFDGSAAQCLAVIKYNASGTLQWSRYLSSGSIIGSYGNGIAIDSSDNIYVAGQYVDLGGLYYGYFVKLNSSGTVQFQRTYRETSLNTAFGITLDSSGNIYVCGDATSTFHVAKWNSTGSLLWSRKLADTTSSASSALAVQVDSSGNVYVAGYATRSGQRYALLAKYNSSGTLQWQRKHYDGSGSYNTQANSLYLDSTGNLYMAGYTYNGSVSFNQMTLFKYDTSGTNLWAYSVVVSGASSFGYGISSDVNSNIYVSTDAGNPYTIRFAGTATALAGTAYYTISASSNAEAAGTATGSNGSENTSSLGTAYSSGLSSVTVTYTPTSYSQSAAAGSGLVWMKGRSGATDHALYDTARGATFELISNSINTQTTQATGLTAFTASGFSIGSLAKINTSSATYVSWTWRETPKFFDIVTYTGTGSARTISHNLGSEPGMMIIKKTIGVATEWAVYHRSLLATQALQLEDTTAAFTATNFWNSTRPTSTVFSLGAGGAVNASGATFVAYLFAHNAGGFGLDGSQNVISCGSYTYGGGSTNPTITLGYEPQWVLRKRADSADNWQIVDNMRGLYASNLVEPSLQPNLMDAESSTTMYIQPTATGFVDANPANNSTYIYVAIRRGPMKVPTDATTVFSPTIYTGNYNTTTPVTNMLPATDVWWNAARTIASSYFVMDRLRGWRWFNTPSTAAETSTPTWSQPTQTTLLPSAAWWGSSQSNVNYFFKRAPGFMDEVCYTGTGVSFNVTHNLGVVPELMIVKNRTTSGSGWAVYSATLGATKLMLLNQDNGEITSSLPWNNVAPTSSVFTVGSAYLNTNRNGDNFVAYLFASCPGVSKVGSYTGTGATQTISCGFTGGARYVMIKRTDSTGSWWVWDTARGMVAGTDPRIPTNSVSAETNANWVYTTTGGFQIVTSDATVNASGGTYIYLAIA
jgi:hypothetical protein